MFAPLRVALSAPCDMAGMNGNGNAMANATSSTHMPDHDMSAMTAANSMAVDSMVTDSMAADMNTHSCCDGASSICSGTCNLGINVSLLLPETSYTPVYKNSFKSALIAAKTLFRELTPPSRPPASLYS